MSSRRRLTRPTAFLTAVLVVLGVGGGASALGDVNASVSETVTLPAVSGGVTLCVAGQCVTTPEPLSEGAELTVEAASSGGATAPKLAVVPATCPEGQSGVAILITTAEVGASVSAKVAGSGALTGDPVEVTQDADLPAETRELISACVKPASVG